MNVRELVEALEGLPWVDLDPIYVLGKGFPPQAVTGVRLEHHDNLTTTVWVEVEEA